MAALTFPDWGGQYKFPDRHQISRVIAARSATVKYSASFTQWN